MIYDYHVYKHLYNIYIYIYLYIYFIYTIYIEGPPTWSVQPSTPLLIPINTKAKLLRVALKKSCLDRII